MTTKSTRIYELGVHRAQLAAVRFQFEDAGKTDLAASMAAEIAAIDAEIESLTSGSEAPAGAG